MRKPGCIILSLSWKAVNGSSKIMKKKIKDTSISRKGHGHCHLGHWRCDSSGCDAKRRANQIVRIHETKLIKLEVVLWSSLTLESSKTVTSYWQCTPSWLKIYETIAKLGWAYHTPNPLCSSDQALNDYHLFVPSKDTLHGTRFEDNECDSVHVLKKWLCLAGQNLVWVKITCTCFSVPIRLCKLMGVLWKKYIFPGHYLCKSGVALA